MIPVAQTYGMRSSWSPIAGGLLTGKYVGARSRRRAPASPTSPTRSTGAA
jgi:aryl-alcohol dehydrogenase-like predicted oxidoreductase